MYILTKSFIESGVLAKDSRVVTVTSGGMYTQKLELDDVQFKKGTFDGTAAYAKHKRQQVVLAGKIFESLNASIFNFEI